MEALAGAKNQIYVKTFERLHFYGNRQSGTVELTKKQYEIIGFGEVLATVCMTDCDNRGRALPVKRLWPCLMKLSALLFPDHSEEERRRNTIPITLRKSNDQKQGTIHSFYYFTTMKSVPI